MKKDARPGSFDRRQSRWQFFRFEALSLQLEHGHTSTSAEFEQG
jgi:hypothetical protein